MRLHAVCAMTHCPYDASPSAWLHARASLHADAARYKLQPLTKIQDRVRLRLLLPAAQMAFVSYSCDLINKRRRLESARLPWHNTRGIRTLRTPTRLHSPELSRATSCHTSSAIALPGTAGRRFLWSIGPAGVTFSRKGSGAAKQLQLLFTASNCSLACPVLPSVWSRHQLRKLPSRSSQHRLEQHAWQRSRQLRNRTQ